LGTRLTTLESGGNYEYVINEIKAINPYLGIDDCVYLHTDKKPKDIIREKNENFFQYYRTIDGNNNLSSFGVKVQTYNDSYKGDLIRIDKKSNLIDLGYEKIDQLPYNYYQSHTTLLGHVKVCNVNRLKISNTGNYGRFYLTCDNNEVFFMEYNDSPTDKDIVFPKGLRFKSNENLRRYRGACESIPVREI
jgi:hypothetical protein